jgi:hypothetical protein
VIDKLRKFCLSGLEFFVSAVFFLPPVFPSLLLGELPENLFQVRRNRLPRTSRRTGRQGLHRSKARALGDGNGFKLGAPVDSFFLVTLKYQVKVFL